MTKRSLLSTLTLLVLLSFGYIKGFGQPGLETYGHNRIQYQRFEWKFYESEHFKVYYYGRGGKKLALFVTEEVLKDLAAIEHSAEGLFPEKFSIMLYNNYDDYRQSNIGLTGELQMLVNNPAGTVNLLGDKIVVYFDGSHENLRRQIRQGMGQVVMEHFIFGQNFKEMVRNAVLLDLPQWITEGYSNYIVEGWTTLDDNDWKNLVDRDSLKTFIFKKGQLFFAKDKQWYFDKKLRFNDLANQHPRLAGKAFWKYVFHQYDFNKIRELLSQIQIKGSINKAAEETFTKNISEVFDTLMTFYQEKYKNEASLFTAIDTTKALIKITPKNKNTEIRNVTVSPRGSDVAYVEWENGEYKVIIQKTKKVDGRIESDKATILYNGVLDYDAESDPGYPILAWDNAGFRLGIVHKRGKNIQIKVYNAIKGNQWNYQIPKNRIERITGFSFLQEDDEIVLSGIKNGKSDIYFLKFRAYKMTPLTDDDWDDKDPIYVSGGSRRGILFLSNRPEPAINIQPLPNESLMGKMNAYFYNLTTKKLELLQLTKEDYFDIKYLTPYGQDNFCYLANNNGIYNRYLILFARDQNNRDSAFTVPATNYGRSILYQNYNPASKKVAETIRYGEDYFVFFTPIDIPEINSEDDVLKLPDVDFIDVVRFKKEIDSLELLPDITVAQKDKDEFFQKGLSNEKETKKEKHGIQLNTDEVFQTDFSETYSQNEYSDTSIVFDFPQVVADSTIQTKESIAKAKVSGGVFTQSMLRSKIPEDDYKDGKRIIYVDSTLLKTRTPQYYLSLKPDFFSLRLDNNLIFNRYQAYSYNSGEFQNPSLGAMMMARLFDKMEDYRFSGGIRFPADFEGLTYLLQFENFRRRIDWSVTFYREQNKQSYNFLIGGGNQSIIQLPGKTITNIVQGKGFYPFTEVTGVNLFLTLRQDQMMIKSKDIYGLQLPSVQDVWTTLRTEFVGDNTQNLQMNIRKGIRYKFFAEGLYKVYSDNDAYKLSRDTSGFKKHAFVYTAGFDVRYYKPIYKNFIFATRLVGAHSGGQQQIIYYLGGVANALNAKFNGGLAPTQKMDYAFQQLGSDLRGYNQNVRNGNTFILTNLELRLPVLTTFIHKPIQSTILKNLQVVAFLDIGNAWEGLIPDEMDNQRAYYFGWPSNAGLPTISVQIPNHSNGGLALGYGLGLRTMLWGYFIRLDGALNRNNDSYLHFTFGTDF